MGFGGSGGGGTTTIASASDVLLNNPADTDILSYQTSTAKWTNVGGSTLGQVAVSAQTGSYTLVLGDAGKAIEITSASSATVTVPPNSSAAFPVGTLIEIARLGTGTVTIAAGSGVTIQSADGALGLRAQYAAASLRKRATNTWLLVGDLA